MGFASSSSVISAQDIERGGEGVGAVPVALGGAVPLMISCRSAGAKVADPCGWARPWAAAGISVAESRSTSSLGYTYGTAGSGPGGRAVAAGRRDALSGCSPTLKKGAGITASPIQE